jgi:hypothetical protein
LQKGLLVTGGILQINQTEIEMRATKQTTIITHRLKMVGEKRSMVEEACATAIKRWTKLSGSFLTKV